MKLLLAVLGGSVFALLARAQRPKKRRVFIKEGPWELFYVLDCETREKLGVTFSNREAALRFAEDLEWDVRPLDGSFGGNCT